MLTVEDGTGLPDADTYVSEADTTAYLQAHYKASDLTAWTGASSGDREIAIRNAQQFLTASYRGRWRGTRANEDQALDWPRSDAFDLDGYEFETDEVPTPLKDAQCELALKALSAELVSDVAASTAGIASESKSIGSISKSVTYVAGGKATQAVYTLADRLLAALLLEGGEIVRG